MFILAAAGVVVLDQIVKRLVTGHLLLFQSIPVAKGCSTSFMYTIQVLPLGKERDTIKKV